MVNWFDLAWLNRKKITIDNTKVAADLNGFPVLISRTDIELTKARTDGFDFVFTKDDGITEIPYEREKWDDATGELIAWVKVDVKDLTDVDIYIYYNNPGQPTDKADPTNVWDINYKGVWHLHDDFLDSTSNNNDATNNGSTDIVGKIGNAQDFDGVNDNIKILHDPSLDFSRLDPFSLSVWIKRASIETGTQGLMGKLTGVAEQDGYQILIADATNFFEFRVSSTQGTNTIVVRGKTGTELDNTLTWYHLVATYDGSSDASGTKLYVNGIEIAATIVTNTLTGNINNIQKAQIGTFRSNLFWFNGIIDEAHISNITRDSNWILTEYNNQNSPSTFVAFGPEVSHGTKFFSLDAILQNIFTKTFSLDAILQQVKTKTFSLDALL